MTLPTVPTVPTIEGTTVDSTDDMYVVIVLYDGDGRTPRWSALAATRNRADADQHYRRETSRGNRVEIIHCTVRDGAATMRKPTVWVIEMRTVGDDDPRNTYEPCAACAISRADAINKLQVWRERNPHDRFRIVRYQRKEPRT